MSRKINEKSNPSPLDTVKWRFPQPQQLSCSVSERLTEIENQFRRMSLEFTKPSSVIGLELKFAFDRLNAFGPDLVSDNQYHRSKIRRLFFRPCTEPILLSFFRGLSDFSTIDIEKCVRLCSALAGGAVSTRSNTIVGSSLTRKVEFESSDPTHSWLRDLKNILNSELRHKYIYGYVRILLAHPFQDGNGRFARNVMKVMFSWEVGCNLLLVPFSVVAYLRSETLGNAINEACVTGNWDQVGCVICECLTDAAAWIDHIN